MIYAFGSNGSGQLGLGHNLDVSVPQKCVADCKLHHALPTKIVAGGNHTLILLPSGDLYFVGRKISGAIELAASILADFQFVGAAQSSEDSRKIKFCSATWEATVLVTRDNQIFTSGNGEKGELGQGADVTRGQTSNEALAFSKLLLKHVEIIDLASSVSHTVVVLSNGDVYGWGNGRKGQLGEPASIVWEPRKIQGIHFNAVRAVCGREFTVIVGNTKEGRYIILGSDKYGIKTMAPPTLSHWKDLGASWGSVFALLVSGKIISWGRNDHGQLVHKDFPSIDRMAVGSEHVLALTQDRRVLAWGWGEHGNCGLQINGKGDAKNGWNEISIPVGEQHGEIRGVGAGCATSWIWTKDI